MPESPLLTSLIQTIRAVSHAAPNLVISPESRLVEDIGIDSLDLVGIYLRIQDDHGVVIDEADLPGLTRVRDLAEYIEGKRSASAA